MAKAQAGKKKPSIGVVTWPILEAGVIPLQGLLRVLRPLSYELHVISGGAARHAFTAGAGAHLYLVEQGPATNALVRVINNIGAQLRVSWKLAKIARHVDFWVFFFGGSVLLLPMLTAKLAGKDVVLNFAGSDIEDARAQFGAFISKVVGFIVKVNCALSDRIAVYSPNLIKEWHLEKYRHKISIAHEHCPDFSKFKTQKPLSERDNLVGYIGRLSQEKGVLNFMEAIPEVLENQKDAEILIGGDGQLRPKVEQYLGRQGLSKKVRFVGWIAHDRLPQYFNDIKLLVFPSYTEGLPTVMLEAMACGTPVLATPMGAIPDVIGDEQTGFIMEDNSPGCIARNIVRALRCSNLGEITQKARSLVEKEFNYEVAVAKYNDVFQSLKK
ncbi:MAG: glycosyltransferase family 1 protein [Dehalococcoidia bacterium]|nr:MAG: glycosyltransferase family 1 protein [Dehalococcoidia bacterium]